MRKQTETKRFNASSKNTQRAQSACEPPPCPRHICALECLAVSVQYRGKALSRGFFFYNPQSRATFCFQSVEIQASPRPHVSLFSGPSVCFPWSAPSAATCVRTCMERESSERPPGVVPLKPLSLAEHQELVTVTIPQQLLPRIDFETFVLGPLLKRCQTLSQERRDGVSVCHRNYGR